MLTYLVAFLISAAVTFVLTPLVRDAAIRHGAVDSGEEERKVHEIPMPRVGGLAIAVGFFVPVIALFFYDNRVSESYLADMTRFAALAGGAAVMVGMGLVDDVRGLSAKVKLAVQILVALGAFAAGYHIDSVSTPFGVVTLGWLALPLTILWIVGIVNAINLIDGLDGLASGISLFTVFVLFILGVTGNNVIVALTAIALAGSLLGFLRYNFNPASIFMGDSGSLFLGYVLAVTAISGSAKSQTAVSLLIPVVALGVPVFDTTLAVLRRLISGKHIFSADRGHVHHRLLDSGLTHRQAVLVLYAGCTVLALGALGLVWATTAQAAVILCAIGVATIVFTRITGVVSVEEARVSFKSGLRRQQRLRDNLQRIQGAVDDIRRSDDIDTALETLVEMAKAVGMDRMECRLAVTRSSGLQRYAIRHPSGADENAHFGRYMLVFPLDGHMGGIDITGELRVSWDAPDEMVQVPEAGSYDWLAMVLRDRVLELEVASAALPLRPRLAAETLPPG
jgi:UDP-GlcNAc:undecaprenyl-phosphate GlcNAc-1-phosphate transferase